MHLNLRGTALGRGLVLLAMLVAGCERTPDPAIAETRQLIGDPAQLTLVAGSVAQVTARALDAAGKPIEGAHIEYRASDPRLVRVDGQGVVTSLGPAGSTSILIANDLRSVTVPIDVVAGPARSFEVIRDSALSIVAGTLPKEPVEVRLVDAYANPVANTPVNFAAAAPPISLSTSTDAAGVAALTLPVVTRAGSFVLEARTAGNPAISRRLDVRVSASSPATLEAVKVLDSGPVALLPDFELVLRVLDAYGNPVPNALVRWRTDAGSGSFDPPQSLSEADGLVRTRWQLTKLKGRRATLRAFVVRHEAVRFQTWIALEN